MDLLWNCAAQLTAQSHTERILKSYYITTCRKLARHNVQLPEDSFGSARMCSRCGNQWADGRYQLHLQPQRLKQSAKNRRLVAQLERVQAKQIKGEMSSGARKRAKWLKKRMASQMAVACDVCQHKTMLPLEKGRKRAKLKAKEETIATIQPTTAAATATAHNKKKTKKMKKTLVQNTDINAGLKIPQQQQKTAQQPSKKPSQPAGGASQNTSQTPGKKKKKAAKPSAPPVQKPQSKTKKQNALLQLAAQLKSHAFKDASKSQENRLQAFLK
ncbi:uncharacterized protein LOC110191562 [Drosophila serrata]|uniref:uncharacterized protein LOC110191562 n=1 Tax=Drosophila serrata TaxID=7274 RepID=UPI000A1D2EC2|nr:uncharacterized protein LOC110191562 [Drosophila serrata]